MCTEHTIPLMLSILRACGNKETPNFSLLPQLALSCLEVQLSRLCPSLPAPSCSLPPTSGLRGQPVTFLSLFRKLLNASQAHTC